MCRRNCLATIGQVGNVEQGNIKLREGGSQAPYGYSAGRSWFGDEPQ